MRFLRTRALVLVAAVSLLAAACDGDDGALTKAEWIKAAEAVCGPIVDDFNALFQDFPTTPEATQEFLGDAAPIFEREVDGLRDIEPPEEDADKIEGILDKGEAGIDDLNEASQSPEAAAELFGAEGGENLTAFEDGLIEYGAEGCNTEGEEEEAPELLDPSTFSPEKRAFVEEGDAICRAANEKISAAEEQFLAEFPPPLENWVQFLDVLIPAFQEQLDGFRSLEPPAEDRGVIEQILSDADELLAQFQEARDAAAAGDQERFDEVIQPIFEGAPEELDARLVEYGFQFCGSEEEGEEGEEE